MKHIYNQVEARIRNKSWNQIHDVIGDVIHTALSDISNPLSISITSNIHSMIIINLLRQIK